MKIYTKGGDKGSTSLFGGARVSKGELRLEAYGTIDELNAHIGIVSDIKLSSHFLKLFCSIQENLFVLGAELASDPTKRKLKKPPIEEEQTLILEQTIDSLEKKLSPLSYFVLPGGHPDVSQTHVARTVCRRAERCIVRLQEQEEIDPLIVQYINRLSDFLFVYSRYLAAELKIKERYWIPKK